MSDFPGLDRREFTLRSALALLGGVTITISPGCGAGGGSSSGGSPTAPSPAGSDMLGAISANHGHSATITSAQLAGGGDLVLNIRGEADHPHTVALTAAELSRIRGQETVSKECSSDGSTMAAHTHMVSFSRAGGPPGPGY